MKTMYESIIGLELHVELNTRSKMFCQCSSDYFGKTPNSQTCPVCLGLPGALPNINYEAIAKCLKIGLALNCQVTDTESFFERKNYFYPDLPKGYQISQYRWPLCIDGWLEVTGKDGKLVKIRINRAHQEEDTGKLAHLNGETVIDFNRSGVPLVEIVTEPDFTDSESVKVFAKTLQQVFRTLGVSDADMEKGQMRLEANVSVRPLGQKELPDYRVELKNINSFNFMASAIDYEIKRQTEVLGKGETITQHTRGWDENKKQTFSQREKEEAHDYRYFPDPDLPPMVFSTQEVEDLKSQITQMPWEKQEKLIKNYGISAPSATILVNRNLDGLFEEAISLSKEQNLSGQQLANYLINSRIDPSKLSAKQILDNLLSQRANIVTDQDQIEKWIKEAIEENPKAVDDYKSGKTNAIGVLIGSVMKKSNGRAESNLVRSTLDRIIRL